MGSHFVVEREQRIEGPAPAVFARIVDLRQWRSWSPWEDLDPRLWRGYEGAESGVGARYEWSGNRRAGTGRMEITGVEPDRSVTIALEFIKPFKSKSTTVFTLEPDGSATLVRWTMTGPKTFMTRFVEVFSSMDKMIGRDFETGLANLKAEIEREAA